MTRPGAVRIRGSGGRTSHFYDGFSTRQSMVATTAHSRAVVGGQAPPLRGAASWQSAVWRRAVALGEGSSPGHAENDYLDHRAAPSASLQRPDQSGVC